MKIFPVCTITHLVSDKESNKWRSVSAIFSSRLESLIGDEEQEG